MQAIDKNTKTHQKRFADRFNATDCYGFFNLLTGPKLLDVVEAQLPEHRERLYTPTLIPSAFTSVLRATIQPSLLLSTAIGLLCKSGRNKRSQLA